MDSLKEKILEKLKHLPENAQQEVLDFVEFLEWRKENHKQSNLSVVSEEADAQWLETDLSNLGSYEPYDWQPEELGEGLPIEYVKGVLVVQTQGAKNWETSVHDLRKERIKKFTSW
ncbi:DUF2281 domain-containing protein [aff. Roholtiella sp. LEGE 12411]|uniref:DUF2281 domain-containing protein n=1 Tax=aff. Roholtiella sp. LEGE 12411 TaxID=1828822 RepID=UPI00188149E1|nr:DUF2281 domain-containing protein [aff. Roholtiella sp. LEGE 12411]